MNGLWGKISESDLQEKKIEIETWKPSTEMIGTSTSKGRSSRDTVSSSIKEKKRKLS